MGGKQKGSPPSCSSPFIRNMKASMAIADGLQDMKRSSRMLSWVAKTPTKCGLYRWSIQRKTAGLSRMSVWSCFQRDKRSARTFTLPRR